MHRIVTAVFFSALLIMTSCGESREDKLAKIKDLEGRLLADSTKAKDEVAAYNLQVAYTDFQEKFPEDELSSEYLFKAADLGINMGWGESSIKILEKFISLYPDNKRTPEALFYIAYVYDNIENDDVKAGENYRAFLQKYPDHAFAESAQSSIQALGKSDEELIREFEEKMKADSLAADSLTS
ncbi:MAG: tetratricopeptide repeat protein [Bacteroidia bacterium]